MKETEISVIVRTNDRPDLLARALTSIRRQTLAPEKVVLVNVGTVELDLKRLPHDCGSLIIERPAQCQGLSRGAALNRGISCCSSTWFTVLDDDDTWENDFLKRMAETARAGVPRACQTTAVFEKLNGGELRELKRRRFNSDFVSLDLVRLAGRNEFTINALLCPLALWKAIGGYREDLAALEDWDFNLRLACETAIDVLPEALANYHIRVGESDIAHRNSAKEIHERVRLELREKWIRDDLRAGRFGLGALAISGSQLKQYEEFPFRRVLGWMHRWWRRLSS